MNYPVKMGIAAVPLTFPTLTVGNYIYDQYYAGTRDWDYTNQMIDNMWYWYKQGINSGLKPYGQGGGAIKNYIVENSGYEARKVILFCAALKALSESGRIDPYYYNVRSASTSPASTVRAAVDTVTALPKESLKIFKTAGIILIVGAGIYFLYPWLKKMKR